jgi:hypothetical protein
MPNKTRVWFDLSCPKEAAAVFNMARTLIFCAFIKIPNRSQASFFKLPRNNILDADVTCKLVASFPFYVTNNDRNLLTK